MLKRIESEVQYFWDDVEPTSPGKENIDNRQTDGSDYNDREKT